MTFKLNLPPQLRQAATPPSAAMTRPFDEPPEEPPWEPWQEPPTATATTPAPPMPSDPARPIVYLYDGSLPTDGQILAIANLCDFAAAMGQEPTGDDVLMGLGWTAAQIRDARKGGEGGNG